MSRTFKYGFKYLLVHSWPFLRRDKGESGAVHLMLGLSS